MTRRSVLFALVVTGLASVQLTSLGGPAGTLVADSFVDGYNGWTDTFTGVPVLNAPPGWRYHFENGTLMEPSDGRAGDGTTNDGKYTPYVLIQDGLTTPEAYTVDARFYTSDDDGFGLVFGWQDSKNYFRAGLRAQDSGNFGFTHGVSVQKVVHGVVTQISPPGVGPGNTILPTTSMVDHREPIDVRLTLDGDDWSLFAPTFNGGITLASGSDAALSPGKVGVLSWAQRHRTNDNIRPAWGTEVDRFEVLDADGATLFHDEFPDISPVQWRSLHMANSSGMRINATGDGDDLGNFGLQFTTRSIKDDSKGFEFATPLTPNVDFIGPAIVVDEAGSHAYSNYEMNVRLRNDDDDGIGVLLRVQDDDNFYRLMFNRQPMLPPDSPGQDHERAPRGLAVHKVNDGVWTELFRDDQSNPLFLFEENEPFDMSVRAVGNQLRIEVIENPDGLARTIRYPLIRDGDQPLLEGTVGLTAWASGLNDGGAVWSAYRGVAGTPLLRAIPEPTTLTLAIPLLGLVIGVRRSRMW